MPIRGALVWLGLALTLAACGPAGNDSGPGGVTVDEAKALDDAAEIVESRRLPEGALDAPPDTADLPPPLEQAEGNAVPEGSTTSE